MTVFTGSTPVQYISFYLCQEIWEIDDSLLTKGEIMKTHNFRLSAVVGLVMLLSRSFDAITDPLIGFLSDRTNTRWGRRRIWMFFSIPLLMIATYKIFFPQNFSDHKLQ